MTLTDYISDSQRRAQLAADAETSGDYLYQIATGRRQASTQLATKIEESTKGEVTRASLRPDVWDEVAKAA